MRTLKITIFTLAVALTLAVTVLLGATLHKYSLIGDFIRFSENEEFPSFADGFVPTGYCECPDGRLILGRDKGDARLYLYTDEGELSSIILYDERENRLVGELGGVAVFDKYIYVGRDDEILVYYYEDVECFDEKVIYYDTIKAFTPATSLSISDGFLFVGGYHPHTECEGCSLPHIKTPAGEENYSLITAFKLSTEKGAGHVRYIIPSPVCVISVRDSLVGLSVDENEIILSLSQGEELSSLELHSMQTYPRSEIILENGEISYKTPLIFLDSSTRLGTLTAPCGLLDIYKDESGLRIMLKPTKKADKKPFLTESDFMYSLDIRGAFEN